MDFQNRRLLQVSLMEGNVNSHYLSEPNMTLQMDRTAHLIHGTCTVLRSFQQPPTLLFHSPKV